MNVVIYGEKVNGKSFEKELVKEQKTIDLSRNDLVSIDLFELGIKRLRESSFPLMEWDELILSENRLKVIDLQPIAKTEIKKLILSNNRLENVDLTPLKSLQTLQELDLSGNRITKVDLYPLSFCKNLELLRIDPTTAVKWLLPHTLQNISNISNYIVNELDKIPTGLSKYSDKIVQDLLLEANLVSIYGQKTIGEDIILYVKVLKDSISIIEKELISIDLTTLKKCHNLKSFKLSGLMNLSKIDLSPLEGLLNLENFILSGLMNLSKIDLSPLEGLLNLESLIIENTILEEVDFKQTKNLKNLLLISLSYNRLIKLNLDFVISCEKLSRIYLSGNQITTLNLNPLRGSNNLEKLIIGNNKLDRIDLIPLENCHNLEEISLERNQIKEIDLKPLGKCKRLKNLNLDSNKLSQIDLTPLKKLRLETIILRSNELKEIDLSPLNNQDIWILDITGNNIKKIDLSPLEKSSSLFPNLLKDIQQRHHSFLSSRKIKRLRIDTGTTIFWKKPEIRMKLTDELNKFSNLSKFYEKIEKLRTRYLQEKEFERLQKTEFERLQNGREKIIGLLNQFHPDVPVSLYRISELTNLTEQEAENFLLELLQKMPDVGKYLQLERVFIKNIEQILTLEQLDKLVISKQKTKKETKTKESMCIYCSSKLERVEDEGPIVCLNCGKKAPYCEVCKNIIIAGEKIVQVKSCNHIFHKNHILEWIKVKGTCPICKELINEESLQPYTPK